MTDQELIDYYANLLILQYVGQPKAFAMMQTLVTIMIANQIQLQVQNAFNLVGDPATLAVGVQLDIIGKYVGVSRNGNDLNGNPISLSDAEFRTLIQIASFTNSNGSSLYDIQVLLHTFFPNQIFVYDNADMQLSYLISSSVGSASLIGLFITEGLLPKPMGVQLSSVVYLPTIDLFGFLDYRSVPSAWSSSTTYAAGARVLETGIVYASKVSGNLNHIVTDTSFWQPLIYPFNNYSTYPSYHAYHWLTYEDGINII